MKDLRTLEFIFLSFFFTPNFLFLYFTFWRFNSSSNWLQLKSIIVSRRSLNLPLRTNLTY